MLLEECVHGPFGASQQSVESVEGPVEEPEVIEVDIQDGGHDDMLSQIGVEANRR